MANFYTDNEDIQFLFKHMDVAKIAAIMEEGFRFAKEFDFAPDNAADAVDNYQRILKSLGELAGDVIAPTAEQTDEVGNVLNADGSVTYAPGIAEALRRLAQADLMGFTLPYRYGGLNCPSLVYTMSNEMISRADASLMNIYGLQGIAETINAFADEAIKQEYLPPMAAGKWTGAMVLTEPDAGSDLQAVKVRAYQDAEGHWFVRGVKRFITNGCGEILLVLARSEPEISDGRGLSLFLTERSEKVRVRHLEEKLGIHGSPTCELVFEDIPARLIGERQRGLITYVMALMNGARVGIAAQSLGIAEAAYRLARTYAHTRQQFGVPIERLPAVAELVTNMQVSIEAARALLYETARACDHENNNLRILEWCHPEPQEAKERKQVGRQLKRVNGMLTPMSKYYCSEMCCRVTHDAIQVLGGSGYMKDYAAERYLRDARITTIYEGTSQLQIVAAVRGVASGSFDSFVAELEKVAYGDPLLAGLQRQLVEAKQRVLEAIQFVKGKATAYLDLAGRKLVDAAIMVIVGHLLLSQGAADDRKKRVARRFIESQLPVLRMSLEQLLAADMSPLDEYDLLAGPVPSSE